MVRSPIIIALFRADWRRVNGKRNFHARSYHEWRRRVREISDVRLELEESRQNGGTQSSGGSRADGRVGGRERTEGRQRFQGATSAREIARESQQRPSDGTEKEGGRRRTDGRKEGKGREG